MIKVGKVRYQREYSSASGNRFMRFAEVDGERTTDVLIRQGRHGLPLHTRAQAKLEAMRQLGLGDPCPNGCGKAIEPGAYVEPEFDCATGKMRR